MEGFGLPDWEAPATLAPLPPISSKGGSGRSSPLARLGPGCRLAGAAMAETAIGIGPGLGKGDCCLS
jgi:hypothetical protein